MATPLDDARYISLETFRKDGSGVKTPVWAAPLDGKLVVMTDGTSYKARRARNDPRIRAAPCDVRGNVRGPFHEGTVRFLEEPAERTHAETVLRKRYGFQWSALSFFSRLAGRLGRRVFLELTLSD